MTTGLWIFIVVLALVSILSIAAVVMYDLNGNDCEDYLDRIKKSDDETWKEEKKDG